MHALFVTDLDGTLVRFEDGSLPEAHRDAIARATDAGIAVAIATGRRRDSWRSDRHRLAGLRLRVSLSNGAVLLGEDNDAPLSVHGFEWEGALRLARTTGAGVHRLLAVTAPDAKAAHDCYVLHADGRVFEAPTPWREATHRAVTLDAALARPLVHAALHVATREQAEEIEHEARAIFAGQEVETHVVRSPGGGGALLEIVVAGGKGRAVRDLASELGIPLERTGAIGDDMNDGRLLDAAAHRYAVGGSVLAARRPDAIEVLKCDEGAVADALERFAREMSSY
jgi:HAD superfamily hydrolase (TIGR01484 family)